MNIQNSSSLRSTPRSPIQYFILCFLLLTVVVQARQQPTSYCKCICFTNSTIIPLNSPPPSASSSAAAVFLNPRNAENGDEDTDGDGTTHHKHLTCSDCNRAFCLDYNLPICKNAKEEDVFTQCFQRDSLKDETVVVIFLFSTTGLLGWALLKPWIDKMRASDTVQRYAPVPGTSEGGGLPTTRSMGGRTRGGFSGFRRGNNEYDDDTQRNHAGRSGRPAANSISRQGGLNS